MIWGSKTEADKGRWVRFEYEEEQILNAIMGEYVPPNKRDTRRTRKGVAPRKNFIPAKSP